MVHYKTERGDLNLCSHLGPLRFNVFVNCVCPQIIPYHILLLADDAKIVYAVSSLDDCYHIQNAITKFLKWCNSVGLTINTNRCKVMTFQHAKEFIKLDYCFDFFPLIRVTEISDLGFPHLIFDLILILLLVKPSVYKVF